MWSRFYFTAPSCVTWRGEEGLSFCKGCHHSQWEPTCSFLFGISCDNEDFKKPLYFNSPKLSQILSCAIIVKIEPFPPSIFILPNTRNRNVPSQFSSQFYSPVVCFCSFKAMWHESWKLFLSMEPLINTVISVEEVIWGYCKPENPNYPIHSSAALRAQN